MWSSSFASRVASSSQTLAPIVPLPTHRSLYFYGVGAGDSAGEGDSVAPSVFGGVFFAALCRFGDGVGVALAAAGAVVVAVVPGCWQEAINAMPIMALIKHNRYFFIGFSFSSTPAECLVV